MLPLRLSCSPYWIASSFVGKAPTRTRYQVFCSVPSDVVTVALMIFASSPASISFSATCLASDSLPFAAICKVYRPVAVCGLTARARVAESAASSALAGAAGDSPGAAGGVSDCCDFASGVGDGAREGEATGLAALVGATLAVGPGSVMILDVASGEARLAMTPRLS